MSFQSAVILARHSADVTGINRYKHFHRPMQLPSNFYIPSNVSNNIDDKKVPPASFLLPHIASTIARNDSRSLFSKVKREAATFKSIKNGKKIKNNFKGLPPINNPNDSINSYSKLPEIPRSQSFDQLKKSKKSISEVMQKSDKSILNGHLKSKKNVLNEIQNPEKVPNATQHSKKTLHKTIKDSVLPTAVKFTSSNSPKKRKMINVRDFGIQTDEINIFTKEPSRDSSTEFSNQEMTQKATQTERVLYVETPLPRKSIDMCSPQEIEEHSELFEIIYQALDETIDKNSRIWTNKMIASSAKLQAEIWRDAKTFVTNILLPSSISLANEARITSSLNRQPTIQRILKHWDQKF